MARWTSACGLLLVLAACGRIGFAPTDGDARGADDGGNGGDGGGIDAGDGAVPLVACDPGESPGPFTTDFAQGVPTWGTIYELSPARMDVFEGTLRGRPAMAPGTQVYAGFAVEVADYRERRVFVQVPQMVDVGGCAQVSLLVHDDDAVDFVELSQRCGTLEVQRIAGLDVTVFGMTPYTPSAHRWWQMRASGGVLHVEVSPDGRVWNELASLATPAYFADAYVELSAGTYRLESAPIGEARFDDLVDCLAP